MPTSHIDDPPDPGMVERLVHAGMTAMERASIPDVTTPSEILSASFILLDRTLWALRKCQTPEDRANNTREIVRVLNEFIVDHGQVPS